MLFLTRLREEGSVLQKKMRVNRFATNNYDKMRNTLFEGSSQDIPSLMELLELMTRDDILYEDVSEEEGNETIFKSKKPAFLKDYPVVDKMVDL
jgi:hypothetical protein